MNGREVGGRRLPASDRRPTAAWRDGQSDDEPDEAALVEVLVDDVLLDVVLVGVVPVDPPSELLVEPAPSLEVVDESLDVVVESLARDDDPPVRLSVL